MWDFPGSGIEPMSPTLAGGFLCTAPPGKFTGAVLEGEHNGLLETGQLSRLSIAVYGLPRSGVKGNSWRNWSWLKWKVPQTSSMGLAAARLQLVFPQEDFKELGKKKSCCASKAGKKIPAPWKRE